jgi:hypothetical protein
MHLPQASGTALPPQALASLITAVAVKLDPFVARLRLGLHGQQQTEPTPAFPFAVCHSSLPFKPNFPTSDL